MSHENVQGGKRWRLSYSFMPPTSEVTGAVIPRTKRNANGEDISRALVIARRRPAASTSSRAIVLRHGRHGIWGDGQVAFMKKISGQEKLALVAGTLLLFLFCFFVLFSRLTRFVVQGRSASRLSVLLSISTSSKRLRGPNSLNPSI
jgi:hypothetical protein